MTKLEQMRFVNELLDSYIAATRYDLAELGASANHPPYENEEKGA